MLLTGTFLYYDFDSHKRLIVLEEHLDHLQHVNNVVSLQWVQDLAGKHWMSKSNDAFNQTYFWVVLNHYIEYKGQAFADDMFFT
jgi:acyl-CoA thioester hydrolase